MEAKQITPILKVSDLEASFTWFAKLGWRKCWDWKAEGATVATFGAVGSGACEIFLCRNGQGGRGPGGIDGEGQGVWISIFVDDVDEIHRSCVKESIEVTMLPRDEPWGCRETHVRHPDGHVLRITKILEEE